MFDDYKKAVRDFYLLKKKKNDLSDNLVNLERSKLRKECLKVFRERYDVKDDEMLKLFFDPLGKFNDHVKSIERFELDKFRPLVSFLQEETNIIRDEEAIKLFAWLIGFYSYEDWSKPPGGLPIPTRPIIICIAFLLIGIGVFFLSGISISDKIRQPLADEKCMYWTGDHYEPAKCDAKIKDAALIPINLRTLNNLRRINLADTLTKHSIGKVWYSTKAGNVWYSNKTKVDHEFFTDSGVYPVDTLKRLRPLSVFILKNHVFYYKYLLIRLMWSIGGIIMVCIIYLFRQRGKVKTRTFRAASIATSTS